MWCQTHPRSPIPKTSPCLSSRSITPSKWRNSAKISESSRDHLNTLEDALVWPFSSKWLLMLEPKISSLEKTVFFITICRARWKISWFGNPIRWASLCLQQRIPKNVCAGRDKASWHTCNQQAIAGGFGRWCENSWSIKYSQEGTSWEILLMNSIIKFNNPLPQFFGSTPLYKHLNKSIIIWIIVKDQVIGSTAKNQPSNPSCSVPPHHTVASKQIKPIERSRFTEKKIS